MLFTFSDSPRDLGPLHPAGLLSRCLCCRQVCQQGFLAHLHQIFCPQKIWIGIPIFFFWVHTEKFPTLKFLTTSSLKILQSPPRSKFSCSALPFHSHLHSLAGGDLLRFGDLWIWRFVEIWRSLKISSWWNKFSPSIALMVWLCGLHSNDVCAVADAIPNRLFFQVI